MTKQELQHFVSQLPDGDHALDDLLYRLSLLAHLHKSLEQADRGELIPMEEIERESERWLTE